MRKLLFTSLVIILSNINGALSEDSDIRLSSLGFLPGMQKKATLTAKCSGFTVQQASDGKTVYSGRVTGPLHQDDPQNGVSLWDARTGDLIFGTREETRDNQIKRVLTADIDPSSPGMECWGDKFFFSAKGKSLGSDVPPRNGLVWWDADLLRELENRGTVSKWRGPVLTRGIQGSVMAWADILGDWREEIVTYVRGELRIYTTVIPAVDRRVCLMQDPLYRLDVAFKAMGYDQPPMTSYYLGVSAADSSKATPIIRKTAQPAKPKATISTPSPTTDPSSAALTVRSSKTN